MTGVLRRLIFAVAVLLPLLFLAAGGVAWSQTPTVVATRITSVPSRLPVTVDGQSYLTPQVFLWPVGSKHSIVFAPTIVGGADAGSPLQTGSQWIYSGVVTNKGVSVEPTLYTADPAITDLTATYNVTHRVRVVYFDCSGYARTDEDCPALYSPGTVYIDGTAKFTKNGEIFLAEGLHTLSAYPTPAAPNPNPQTHSAIPGWIFVGFYDASGTNGNAYLNSFFLRGPTNIYPRFVRARAVTVDSWPTGLRVLADRTTVTAPQTLDWGRTTTHTVGVVPDQLDNTGKLWVFDSWSDGGTSTHAYTVPDGDSPTPLTLTARFIPGERVSFITRPQRLQLNIDGRSNWQSYNFNWGVGSTHTVTAPRTQRDSSGRTWQFKGWSNAGAATQTVTVPSDLNGLGLTLYATYDPLGVVQILSAVPGMVIQVDGQDCPLPCVLERDVGLTLRLTAPASLPLGDDARLDFMGWSDSGSPDRTLLTTMDPVSLTLNYQRRNRLVAKADPPEGVRLRIQPESADGFYDAQAQVQLNLDPKPGYRFLNWAGDASGSSRLLILTMDAPKTVRAVLDRVPTIADNGVRNAAGDTPLETVAAGSIVSILGFSLAPSLEKGPDAPLAQALANVTVRIGARLLPLFFVSPEQINVALPSDLPEGPQRLTVRWEGKPEVSADFSIVRNAPGLFYQQVESRNYGLVLHENGDPVSVDSPARRGETVTLLGTGFGPLLAPPIDGFPLPDSDNFRLADALELRVGEARVDPLYAGGAPGRIGMNAVRFRIGSELPSGPSDLKVRINQSDSNTVVLVVE